MTGDSDPFRLERFVQAQAGVFETALAELRAGAKRSHWMWFVFPQVEGLGSSPTARFYALGSLAEAQAYLAHPVLGPRLEAAVAALGERRGRTLNGVLGSPDDLKFRSSMTLFAAAGRDTDPFRTALDLFCAGRPDERTLALLSRPPSPHPSRPDR